MIIIGLINAITYDRNSMFICSNDTGLIAINNHNNDLEIMKQLGYQHHYIYEYCCYHYYYNQETLAQRQSM